jgi:hypothetical protein
MGYIFETEIEIITNTVRGKTIGEEETIRLRDLLASDIHPAIKSYFKNEVEWLLQQERALEVRSKKFPYTLPEISRLYKQIDLLLVYNYQFGRLEFETMLDHAVHFQFNYLCRPRWTMLNFIFEHQRRRTASEIERKLRYCVDYSYYTEIVQRYMEEHGVAEMSYEEFSELLEKIDREILAAHTSVELALMARPMLRFIEAGQPVPAPTVTEARIPINAAIVFFEDKSLVEIKERLERERDSAQRIDITLPELATLIERVRTGNEGAEVQFPRLEKETPAPPAGERSATPRVEETAQNSRDATAKKAPVKIYSDFSEEELHTEGTTTRQFVPRSAAVQNSDGLEDLHLLFTPNEQKVFARKIFRRDEVEFRDALDKLNAMKDWKDASAYLKELFIANDVDPFSEEAILFTDKIQSRYLPLDSAS